MTNPQRAAYFGALAADAMRAGHLNLAVGYGRLAGHWGTIYLNNVEHCRRAS